MPYNAHQPAWAVAAAILYVDDTSLDVKILTKQVVESKLSGLGRYGDTPRATLAVQLKQPSTPKLFAYDYNGFIGLRDPASAITNRKVREAVSRLTELRTMLVNLQINQIPEELPGDEPVVEGASKTIVVNAFERNAELRVKCIAKHGAKCSVCGMSFGDQYGSIVDGYIHVHHLHPLAEVRAAHTVDPVADLRPVCPNCHAVIHRRVPPYSIQEVQAFRNQMQAQEH